jgi:hypothetical protein
MRWMPKDWTSASTGSCRLFELGSDVELLHLVVKGDAQHIRFAAYLAVFNVTLLEPGGMIHLRVIPLAAARTLKTGFHLGTKPDPAFCDDNGIPGIVGIVFD